MIKNRYVICSFICLLTASFSYGEDQNANKSDSRMEHKDSQTCIRPYIGIIGGVAPLAGTYKATEVTPSGSLDSASLGGTEGLVGGVYGVQIHYCKHGFFALQANTLYNTTNQTVSVNKSAEGIVNAEALIKNHFQWGGDARFGFRVRSANPYILGGFESGRWEMKLKNDSDGYERALAPYSTESRSKTLWGGKVGAGVTFPLFNCLWANMEYSYTWFGHIKTVYENPTNGNIWTHKVSIQQNSLLFGLNYLF